MSVCIDCPAMFKDRNKGVCKILVESGQKEYWVQGFCPFKKLQKPGTDYEVDPIRKIVEDLA